MKFKLDIKPLSINMAFQGRRFKTRSATQYDRALALLLPKQKVEGEYFKVKYHFYLVNFSRTDCDNLVKNLQDCIVRQGIITDDRRIIEYEIKKFKAEKDSIVVEILAVNLPILDPQK